MLRIVNLWCATNVHYCCRNAVKHTIMFPLTYAVSIKILFAFVLYSKSTCITKYKSLHALKRCQIHFAWVEYIFVWNQIVFIGICLLVYLSTILRWVNLVIHFFNYINVVKITFILCLLHAYCRQRKTNDERKHQMKYFFK